MSFDNTCKYLAEQYPEDYVSWLLTDKNITGCTEILAGLRFEKDLIHQFLREEMMQESVIYQDILQKGEKKAALKWVMKILNRQFGELNSFLIERIQALSAQQLETLRDVLLDFTTENDLILWLNQQENSGLV